MDAFLTAWKNDDYASMYAFISTESQAAISQDDFVKHYRNAMNALMLQSLSYQVSPGEYGDTNAQVKFHIDFKSLIIGDLARDMTAPLVRDNGQWRITWDDGLILPELKDGSHLQVDFSVPARGSLLDRNGKPIAEQSDAVALGIIPSQLIPEQEGSLLAQLADLFNVLPGAIKNIYDNQRDATWYLALGEAPASVIDKRIASLSSLGGLVLSPSYSGRFYYNNGIAPQAIGYVSPVPIEQLDQYLRQGYSSATRVGKAGIEQWGEKILAGKTGATLYLVKPDGTVSPLGKIESQPSSSITLTLDNNLQIQAQKAIEGIKGSIVVMERDTGRVLAMASYPGYDPNLFEPRNANWGYALGNVINDPNNPLVNRATQGQYQLGSVFKVITFSAALESSTFTPETKLQCGYDWTELTDIVRYDWTWEHFQNELLATGEGHTQPSGELTLSEGLMRSCNPWFWHIGLDLYKQGRITAVAQMARGFGLGKLTGIGQIEELPGQINDPPAQNGEVEAVNQAIGQGSVQVTPLQVADMMAAIGNGGTLYRPQLVEKITDASGAVTQVYKPESRGVLPIQKSTLDALQAAMLSVIRNPRGTAYIRFTSIKNVPIYGKTGTAESGSGNSHAWFAGYTDAQNPALPDIAIAVIAENGGEGSVVAAPIFKRMVETYFFGHPVVPYPWESNIGITRTPTVPVTPTLTELPPQ